jgi:uncharacterized membrane protein YfcA
MPCFDREITLGEMRSSGVRGLLVYCADYKCAHSVSIGADRWPDDIRLSDLEFASAASHIYHRNVDWRMVARLGVAGALGAILGAWVLSNIEVTAARRFVYAYLLIMGLYILWKSRRVVPIPRTPAGWTAVLGFGAGFLDATGGGGWGPITTTTLVGSGHAPRYSVGSVNTAEFFVTVSAATTFFTEIGAVPLEHLIPLVLGGVLAAPFGGWFVKHVPARGLMTAVGVLIVMLSLVQLFRALRST